MKIGHEFSQYIAEFVGTFFLVFFGCGAVILVQTFPDYHGAFIPFAFGGAVSIMIYATGHISGAHFNPAVTLAFFSIKKFPLKRVFGYICAQSLGAVVASSIHCLIFKGAHDYGATGWSTSLSGMLLVEGILSFSLMFVIVSVATDSRAVGELAGIAIGSTVAICAMIGGPLTGASMNPARSLGPYLFAQGEFVYWPYLVAPIIGAILGAWAYQGIKCLKDGDEDSHGCC